MTLSPYQKRKRGIGLSPDELAALAPSRTAPPHTSPLALHCLVLKEAHRQLQLLQEQHKTTEQQILFLQAFIQRKL